MHTHVQMAAFTGHDVLNIPHLATLTLADAEKLSGELVVRSYQPREMVTVEGEPCRGF